MYHRYNDSIIHVNIVRFFNNPTKHGFNKLTIGKIKDRTYNSRIQNAENVTELFYSNPR